MSKKAWYWIVGVIVVVVIIWMFVGKSGDTVQTTSHLAKQSLISLIDSGVTQTCTFSVAATASTSSMTGNLYFTAGNMRGDFAATSTAGQASLTHVIVASSTGYIWMDKVSSRGFKMPWAEMASSTAVADSGVISLDQPTDYSCHSWTPDQTLFTLPGNIQFSDISALMNDVGSESASSSAAVKNACARCAKLPAAYRGKCLAALHC